MTKEEYREFTEELESANLGGFTVDDEKLISELEEHDMYLSQKIRTMRDTTIDIVNYLKARKG
jgi:hypothetical protein